MRIVLLCLLTALAYGAPADAADYRMAKGSSLGFTASYDGEAFEGRFKKFTPLIRFDPKDLAHSRFEVRIALASASTDNADRDEMLVGSDFFDAARLPEAVYTATRFRAVGGNRFVAEGELNLRGIRKPVALNFSWTAGATPVLAGEATLQRLDFKVGEGDWADTETLPNAVKVKTRLLLIANP